MKKLFIILFTLVLILSGCKKKYEPDFELLYPIQSVVMDYLNLNGYDENQEYLLFGPYTSEGNQFPRAYELRINGIAEVGVYCDYSDEPMIGGVDYQYKDGYVFLFAHPDVLNTMEGWKTENNSVNVNSWFYKGDKIVIDEKEINITDDMIELMKGLLSDTLNGYPENVNASDRIGVYGPIMQYFPKYNYEDESIHLFQQDFQFYFIIVNSEPVFLMTFEPKSESMGLSVMDIEYQYFADMINVFNQGKPFIVINPETVITSEKIYSNNRVPVLTRMSMGFVKEKVKSSLPYECIAEFEFAPEQ